MNNPWRLVEWTDENRRAVKSLAFHESELDAVLALPFPSGAVAREPVMMLTEFTREYCWFKKRWCGLRPGHSFEEEINQAKRQCYVLAVNGDGQVLYKYEMPNGRTYLRIDGKPITQARLPRKWRELAGERLEAA